jgi:hypothetical protein
MNDATPAPNVTTVRFLNEAAIRADERARVLREVQEGFAWFLSTYLFGDANANRNGGMP